MSKHPGFGEFLNIILLFALIGCSHGAESPSSPADVQSNSAPKATTPVSDDAKPSTTSYGSSLAVDKDGNEITGTLIARCFVTEEGNVEQCAVIQNPFATKDADLMAMLQKLHLKPTIVEGKPRRVPYTFKIRFVGADDYTNDLHKICRVHEITDKSPELGVQAVAQWLIDNVKTPEARKRLAELPTANIPIWLQTLRKDAKANRISTCPFADYWEEFLKRPALDEGTK